METNYYNTILEYGRRPTDDYDERIPASSDRFGIPDYDDKQAAFMEAVPLREIKFERIAQNPFVATGVPATLTEKETRLEKDLFGLASFQDCITMPKCLQLDHEAKESQSYYFGHDVAMMDISTMQTTMDAENEMCKKQINDFVQMGLPGQQINSEPMVISKNEADTDGKLTIANDCVMKPANISKYPRSASGANAHSAKDYFKKEPEKHSAIVFEDYIVIFLVLIAVVLFVVITFCSYDDNPTPSRYVLE